MTTEVTYHGFLSQLLQKLASPVFVKELRVTSRRRRSYVLRFAYVGLLTLVIVQIWFVTVGMYRHDSAVVRASRMGEAGMYIAISVVWFQFITGQILAAVLLSDAISREVRQRTLDALLVTPIRGLHIVTGKLLGKLLQLVSLLAISLPMLAVARAFGGVPWDYVVSGLCLTLTVSVFVGSLSLFVSALLRHAHQCVLIVGLACVVVWGIGPGLLIWLAHKGYLGGATVTAILSLTNPFLALLDRTQAMRGSGAVTGSLWQHCLVLLTVAAAALLLCVWRMRRVALVYAVTHAEGPGARVSERVRPVRGSPIVWKELCKPLFPPRGRRLLIGTLLVIAAGLGGAAIIFRRGEMAVVWFILTQVLQLLFILDIAVSAAMGVVKEKEARTWAVLLATPLENREIVKGKAVGILRRNLPLLAPLPLFYLFAYLSIPGQEHGAIWLVLAVGWVAVTLAGSVTFLLGVGLYLSTRLRTTTAAVAATLAVYLVPKFFCCGTFNPLFVVPMMAFGAGGQGYPLFALVVMCVPLVAYLGIGLLFLGAAIGRVRRDVF